MAKQHEYSITTEWTGNTGFGTANYSSYERAHNIHAGEKTPIACSSDPAFRGDRTRYNPEELLVASLSSCHMLWYLHLCAEAGVVVKGYTDHARGFMEETKDGGGKFTRVVLYPQVTVQDASMIGKANELHHQANVRCFIANSVNFPIEHVSSADI